jgi:hypothetical protein
MFTQFLHIPWGLIFLLFIGFLAYREKLPGFLNSLGMGRNMFLFMALLLLAGSFFSFPAFFLRQNIYINLGGLISMVFAVYFLRTLHTEGRVRSLLACILILALTFATTSGVLWRMEEIFPPFYYLLPLFLTLIALFVTRDAVGSVAALILGVWLSDVLSIIFFGSLQAAEVGGLISLNTWLVSALFVFIFTVLHEAVQNKRLFKGTSA